MKYNEAIDMILDGGRAQPVNSPRWTNRAVWIDLNNDGIIRDFTLSKEDVLAGWIVEKDGVVYEEYPGKVISREIIADGWRRDIPDGFIKVTSYLSSKDLYKIPMTEFGYKKLDSLLAEGDLFLDDIGTPCERVRSAKLIKSRANEQDEPAELEEPKQVCIDEDWLEKKMLCFLSRHVRTNPIHNLAMHYCEQEYCGISKCPFCFYEYPKESKSPWQDENLVDKMSECIQENCIVKPKPDHIPDASNMVDEPRKKVTVEDILYLINGVVGAEIADTMALFCPNYDEETRTKMRKGSAEALYSWGGKLKRKLEYLVSLQDK